MLVVVVFLNDGVFADNICLADLTGVELHVQKHRVLVPQMSVKVSLKRLHAVELLPTLKAEWLLLLLVLPKDVEVEVMAAVERFQAALTLRHTVRVGVHL